MGIHTHTHAHAHARARARARARAHTRTRTRTRTRARARAPLHLSVFQSSSSGFFPLQSLERCVIGTRMSIYTVCSVPSNRPWASPLSDLAQAKSLYCTLPRVHSSGIAVVSTIAYCAFLRVHLTLLLKQQFDCFPFFLSPDDTLSQKLADTFFER